MPGGDRRRRLLRLHLGLALAILLCGSGFGVELWRALGGNTLSWAYTVEWPFLLGYGVYMWRKLVAEEKGLPAPGRARGPGRRSRGDARAEGRQQEEDRARAEWNRYLAALHAAEGHDAERP